MIYFNNNIYTYCFKKHKHIFIIIDIIAYIKAKINELNVCLKNYKIKY